MKKLLALLCVCLLLPLGAALGESVVVNRISGTSADFAFPADATLLEVYFPKINGCDAAFIRYGEFSMLLDCAGNEWREVETLLNRLNVTHVTYALNSHPDADHIGGFNHILKNVPADEFLLGFPENYDEGDTLRFKVYEDLHALGIPFRQVRAGDTIAFGDVKMTAYQRTDAGLTRVNNKSLMVMMELGERRIFFTGDVQRDAQNLMIGEANTLDLHADILKAPHHGYNNMQAGFLAMVSPELVIITSGRGGAGVTEQLKTQKIPYYFCENGILRLATDGTVWTVERMP